MRATPRGIGAFSSPRMKNGSLFLTLAAVIGLVIAMVRLGQLDARVRELSKATPVAVAAPDPEVAVYMARIQVYMHKLYWAGMAQNVPLADFYRHEIKEVMAEVAKAGIVDEGVNVSAMMSSTGIPAVDAMKTHLQEKGVEGFAGVYNGLVDACNTCHKATGHGMIQVQVPSENRYTDQVFVP